MTFKRTYAEAKESYKPMKRGNLRAVGKKGQRWIGIRKDLKQRFEWAGITTCEARLPGCWFNDSLGFAHCKKRREIQGDEIWHVALLCSHCHNQWEVLPHEAMNEKIHGIIDRRGLIAPPAVLQQVSSCPYRG